MYGIVEVSGHQFKVVPGDLIDIEKVDLEVGKSLEINKVLFIGGDNPLIGLPTVPGATVKAQVVKQAKSRKILIMKKKPAGKRSKSGHRQPYSALLITEINDGKGNVKKIDKECKNAQKFLK